MTHALQRELNDERTRLMALTTDQYHRMIETGILVSGEPYELLDGVLVHKDRSRTGDDDMTVGMQHAMAIRQLHALASRLGALEGFMQIQLPVTMPPLQEPEPDAAFVLGAISDFADRHPTAADVSCVIEVADASLRRDRTTKQRIYADAGIGQYVIVNLVERVVEVYISPVRGEGRYAQMNSVQRDGVIELHCGGDRRISVSCAELLP